MHLVPTGPDAELPDDLPDDTGEALGGLTRMIKVEVVVDAADETTVRDLLLEGGAVGYTALGGVSGFGHHGHHEGRLLFNDRASLSMLISVVPTDRAPGLVRGIRRLLDQRPGVLFVSTTYVSRPQYFTG